MKKLFFITTLFFASNSLYALELKGTFHQGNMILGKTEKNSKVFVDESEVKVSDHGFFVFGLSKKRKNDVLIEVVKKKIKKSILRRFIKKHTKYKKLMVYQVNK